MTFPPLLLGLPFGALVASLLVSSWLAHVRPLGADGRRVAEAAERAGLGQGIFSLGIAACAVLVVIAFAALLGFRQGAPILPFVLVPLATALVAVFAGLVVARLLTRAACRQLGSAGRDQKAVLLSRSALAATLALEATSGLVVLGTFVWVERSLGSKLALGLAFVAASTIAVLGVVFGRSAATLLQTSTRLVDAEARGAEAPGAPMHAGTLSEVVAATFGRALLSSSTLLSVSSLGHALLLAHTVLLSTETNPSSALYPHVLRALGLLALLFGGLVVRSSERETAGAAWARGTLVTFVLLVAGAWSLAPSLRDPTFSRLLPGGASLLWAGAGGILWLTTLVGDRRGSTPLGATRLVQGLAFAALGLVFFWVLELSRGEGALPETLVHALFVACLASLVTVVHGFRLAHEIAHGARLASVLTGSGSSPSTPAELGLRATDEDMSPPEPLSYGYWILLAILGFEALSSWESAPGSWTVIGLGALTGTTVLLVSLTASVRAGSSSRERARSRVLEQIGAEATAAPSFGPVLEIGRDATKRGLGAPLLFALGAPLVWLALGAHFPSASLGAARVGFAVGALLLGAGLGFSCEAREPKSLLGHASYAFPLALGFVTLVTTGTQLF